MKNNDIDYFLDIYDLNISKIYYDEINKHKNNNNNIIYKDIMNSVDLEAGNIITIANNTNNIDEWRSCCFKIQPNALKFFIQSSVLISLIIFSSIMLVVDDKCESQRNYGSLLMFCLGCIMPSPKLV